MADEKISFEELEAAANQQAPAKGAETPAATPTPEVKAEDAKPQFTDADVTAYLKLRDLGITPDNASDFIQAKQGLANLGTLLDQNPRLLIQEIEKSNPALGRKFKEAVSDMWFEDYQREHPEEGTNGATGSVSRTPASALTNSEVAQLTQTVKQLQERLDREDNAKRERTIFDGYNSAVQAGLDKLKEKGLDELKLDHVRLKTYELLGKDQPAWGRVQQGVYVDIPKYISEASRLVTAETKAAANAEHERRSAVQARGSKEIVPAAENVNGSAQAPSGDIWDPTAMVKELAAGTARR